MDIQRTNYSQFNGEPWSTKEQINLNYGMSDQDTDAPINVEPSELNDHVLVINGLKDETYPIFMMASFVSWFTSHRASLEDSIIMEVGLMWSYLRQFGVITQDEEERFKIGRTRRNQVTAVLDHLICKNEGWMFEAFITALVNTDQEHILEPLHVQLPTYDKNMDDVLLPHDPTKDAGFQIKEHLWDRANSQCVGILQDHPIYSVAIKGHRVYLVKYIDLHGLWPYLRQYDVIDVDMEEEIKTSPTQQQRVERLLDYLLKGPVWKFHGLLRSLAETGQEHIVTGLNIDPCIYTTNDYHLDEISTVRERLSQHYMDCANNCNVMKFVYKSPRVDLQKTYVKLLLLSSVNEVVAGSRLEDARIEESEIFETSSINTLVEGDPGTGKTYLALHLAHAWIIRDERYQFTSIDLFIFIRPIDIRDSFEATILAALKGSDREKRVMFAFWKWHPEKCCIVVDALDEISSNVKVVNELFNLMENKACFFIITCRTQHPVLDMRTNVFQRIVRVVGFDESDVAPFITKFLSEPDMPTPEHVSEICEVVSKDSKLSGLCCNPLVACLICLLVAERQLTAQSLAGLTLLEIYQKIEELILLRENKRINEDMRRDLHILHKLALRSLLFNKHSYTAQELVEYGITSNATVLVFLQKNQSRTLWLGFEESFNWLHRSFMEFAAAMAMEGLPNDVEQLLICHICSRRDLNHVGHFLAYFFQEDPEQLALVCNATLALQQPVVSKTSCTQCVKSTQDALISECSNIDEILMSEDHPLIRADQNVAKMLRPCSCFMENDSIDVSKGLATIHQATRCLLSAKMEYMKADLAKTSLHSFLPIQWKKHNAGYMHVLAVPDSPRVVIVTEEYVTCNEFYYHLVHPKDLLTCGALEHKWLSNRNMGPLNGLVLNFSDPEMNATFGFHNPSAQDLTEVLEYIAEHPKPVLSGLCSLLLLYPTQANINPVLEILNADLLRMLHRRGIRRFIIWDGHTTSEALIQWLERIENQFRVQRSINLIGNWMRISEPENGLLSRATNLLFWRESLEMEFLFYGLDIFSESPSDISKEHTKRLKQTGLFQHSHWIQPDVE